MQISNYELGIVFPLRESGPSPRLPTTDTVARSNANAVATNVAAHKRPARPYGKKDVPWVSFLCLRSMLTPSVTEGAPEVVYTYSM